MVTSRTNYDKWAEIREANGGRVSPEQREAEQLEIKQKSKAQRRAEMRQDWLHSEMDWKREAAQLAVAGYGCDDIVAKMRPIVSSEEARILVLGG